MYFVSELPLALTACQLLVMKDFLSTPRKTYPLAFSSHGLYQLGGRANEHLDDHFRCAADRMVGRFYGVSCRWRIDPYFACLGANFACRSLCCRKPDRLVHGDCLRALKRRQCPITSQITATGDCLRHKA